MRIVTMLIREDVNGRNVYVNTQSLRPGEHEVEFVRAAVLKNQDPSKEATICHIYRLVAKPESRESSVSTAVGSDPGSYVGDDSEDEDETEEESIVRAFARTNPIEYLYMGTGVNTRQKRHCRFCTREARDYQNGPHYAGCPYGRAVEWMSEHPSRSRSPWNRGIRTEAEVRIGEFGNPEENYR